MPRTNRSGHASASARPPFIIAVGSRAQMLAMPVATLIWLVAARMMAEAQKPHGRGIRRPRWRRTPSPRPRTRHVAGRPSARTPWSRARRRRARGLGPCWLACVLLDEGQHLSPGIRRGVLVLFEGAVEERVGRAL